MSSERISAARRVASDLHDEGQAQYGALLFPVPTRLSLSIYSYVEVLTHRAGVSRNKMVNRLIDAGIEAVLAELDGDVVAVIEEKAHQCAEIAIERNAGLMERGDE